MSWKTTYTKWKDFDGLAPYLKDELNQLASDEKSLEDAFYRNLSFGTAGMRGILGVGTNRMNIYTVRKASLGLANYITSQGEESKQKGVAIAYDCRHFSPEFSMEAARVLATHGIKVYLYDDLRATPQLSFAVRHLNCFAGIVITASHNPREYNGYKVYNATGAQVNLEEADQVIRYVNAVEDELSIEAKASEELINAGFIEIIGEEIDAIYNDAVVAISEEPTLGKETDVNVVFTPLHGTSNLGVRRALSTLGYENVFVVPSQELPNGDFPSVKLPNPEEYEAYSEAITLGNEKNADILVATDPDADRLGVCVRNNEEQYILLNGNQTGALLMDYILKRKSEKGEIPANGIVFKTIVSSELGRAVAASYDVACEDVLTGFKFIGEKIEKYNTSGAYKFLFGYEESYGCLVQEFTRDKDAIQAAVIAVEACAYYKKQGLTLLDALDTLFEKHGAYVDGIHALTLGGKTGAEQIVEIMNHYRESDLSEFCGIEVASYEDYKLGTKIDYPGEIVSTIELPSSDVLKFHLRDGSWLCLRPSGTEPKIKFYFSIKDDSKSAAEAKLDIFIDEIKKQVAEIIK